MSDAVWEALNRTYAWETASQRDVGVGMDGTATLCEANPGRIALVMRGEYAASSYGLYPVAGFGSGLQWPSNGEPVTFSYSLHGALVQQAWFAYGGAGDTISVIEVIRERDLRTCASKTLRSAERPA